LLFVDKNAQGRTIEIVELSGSQRPEECRKAEKAQEQSDRDQEKNTIHRAALLNLSALPITMIDDPDIASAAISGVTRPMIASGTAIAL